MSYQGTFGVHFLPHHPVWDELTAPELVRIAETAAKGDLECIWFATRFLARDALTLMSMLSARVPMSLGTLVANPWGRNPLELVSALGAIAEMLPEDREVRFGIGSGVSHSRWVERPRPLRFVRETIEVLRALASGRRVAFDDYPAPHVSAKARLLPTFPRRLDYFHLRGGGELTVEFARPEAVSFWFALTGGPLGDELAVRAADGGLPGCRNGSGGEGAPRRQAGRLCRRAGRAPR